MNSAAKPEHIPARILSLDGLRGWAAVAVLMFHLTWETFGHLFPVFRSFPVVMLSGGGGTLALATFFATSGYLLTIRRWRVTGGPPVVPQMARRYVRLTVPLLGSTLLYFAVIALGLSYAAEASDIVDRGDWLGYFGSVEPNLLDAITYGIYRVYLYERSQNFGPFLWAMVIQLWGSLILLPIAYKIRVAYWPYIILISLTALIYCLFPVASAILMGALFALVQRDFRLFQAPPERRESVLASCAFVGCIAIASFVERGGAYEATVIQTPLSVILLWATLRSLPLTAFFTAPVSIFIGTISFPIYLVQCAILISLTSWLIVQAQAAQILSVFTATLIAGVTVAVTLVVARLFLPVEMLAGYLVRQIDTLLGKTATVARQGLPNVSSSRREVT